MWREISTPKIKGKWPGMHLRLLETPPRQRIVHSRRQELPVRRGDVCRIMWRRSWAEANECSSAFDLSSWACDERVVILAWECPCCDEQHRVAIPEKWIAEGKAVFVEWIGEEDE